MLKQIFGAFGILLGIICVTMLGMFVIEGMKVVVLYLNLATTYRP